MSSYGAVAFQYRGHIPVALRTTYVLDKSMLSSSIHSKPTSSQGTLNQVNTATEVEVGKDPLSDPQVQIDSFLTDYSFCNVELKDCSSPKPGTASPLGDTSGYYIPSDYPKHLGLDTEFQITGSKEPYVMAEFSNKDDLNYLGKPNEMPPKGSLNLSAIDESPGGRMEHSLRSIPALYPELSFDTTSSQSHLLSEETTPVTKPSIPTSVPTVGKKFKPRANPFNDEQTHLKRNASSVAYCEIVKPVAQLQPSPKPHQPTKMLDNFVESSSVASSSSSYEEPPYKYDIPSYHPKLKGVKSQGQTSDQIDEVMTHLKGTINNAVQYIASLPGNNFETASSICFLGKLYIGKHHEDDRKLESDSVEDAHGSFHEFLKDFQSRVWVTYRRGFACLQGTNLKSDTGWGCMLRTGQMMLATALQIHCFGREYRRHTSGNQYRFKELVRHFGDSFDHPFSLQHLLKIGKEHLNKSYGEWYGPSTVAYVLRVCVDYAKEKGMSGSIVNITDFTVFTATDCMVFKGDIVKTATLNGTRSWTKILVLISVRMGADELNLSYRQSIQEFLMSPMCVGIMGGRKRHSLYFTGFQGNKLIHYDPHTCQTALKINKDFSAETYVCMKPRKMSFSKMDPSCTFGFYLKSADDLLELTRLSESMGSNKIFDLLDGTKDDYLLLVHDPSVKAFDHNESMFDDGSDYALAEIASLEGSDFEYLE